MDNHKLEESILDNQEDFSPFQRSLRFRKRKRRVWLQREDGSELELESPFLFPELDKEEDQYESEAPSKAVQLPAIPASIVEQWGNKKDMLAHIEKLAYSVLPQLKTKAAGKWTLADKKQFKTVSTGVRKKLFESRHQLFQSGAAPFCKEKIPFGFTATSYTSKVNDVKVTTRGLKNESPYLTSPRLDKVLAQMQKEGKIQLTQDDLDMLQRVANVETSGMVQTLNSYDRGIVSSGFIQYTIHVGKMQKWIGTYAAKGYARYGIELDPTKTYTIGGTKHPAIKGAPDKEQLRWGGWAERFYYAGLDPEVIKGEVEYALAYFKDQIKSLRVWIRSVKKIKTDEVYNKFVNNYYNKNGYIRALFQESFNNSPKLATKAVYDAITQFAAAHPAVTDWLEDYKQVLINKGKGRLVEETAIGTNIVLDATQQEFQYQEEEPGNSYDQSEYEEEEDVLDEIEDAAYEVENDEQEDVLDEVEDSAYEAAEDELEDDLNEVDDSAYEVDDATYEAEEDELEDETYEEEDDDELENETEMEASEEEEGEPESSFDEAEEEEDNDGEYENYDKQDEEYLLYENEDAPAEELEYAIENEFVVDASKGKTAYLNVSAIQGKAKKTGLFIPVSFQPSSTVDVLVFLHGLYGPGSKDNGIESYWKNYSNIRDHFYQSGKNAILLAPTLGSNPQHNMALLNASNGFDKFINACFEAMKAQKHLPADAVPGRIILAAHSAGGKPLSGILQASNQLLSQVVECWGFDCLYGYSYDKWLKKDRRKNLLYHYWAYTNAGYKSRPGKNGDALVKLHSNIKNIAPKKGIRHQGIIAYAWRNAINKRTWFDALSAKENEYVEAEKPATPLDQLKTLYTQPPISKNPKVVVKRNDTDGTAEIKDVPEVYIPIILKNAGEDAKAWFKSYVKISFLGRELNSGQHIHHKFARLLLDIEAKFMKDKRMNDAAQAGDALGLTTERMAGSREDSSTAAISYHMLGLAVDVNYKSNPFIQAPAAFSSWMRKVRWLTSGKNTPLFSWAHRSNPNLQPAQYMDFYDKLTVLNTHFLQYFSYLDNPEALRARLKEPGIGVWQKKDLNNALKEIRKDRATLSRVFNRKGADADQIFKKTGFLNLSREFVSGMVGGGLDWGARYGDMMHFDMRRTGVGGKIENAKQKYLQGKTKEARAQYTPK